MFALGNLGGGFVEGSLDATKQDNTALQTKLARDQAALDAQARKVVGNTIMAYGGGQVPQAPMPGQPSQPMQMPTQFPAAQPSPLARLGQAFGQMMPAQQLGPGQPMPQMGGQQSAPIPPQMPQGMPQVQRPPQPMPQQAQAPQPMPGPQGGQGMSLVEVAQKMRAANPDASPEAIAMGMQQFMPLMNTQAKMDYQQGMLALREQQIEQRMQELTIKEAGLNGRAATANETRIRGQDIGAQNTDKRLEVAREKLQQEVGKAKAVQERFEKRAETKEREFKEKIRLAKTKQELDAAKFEYQKFNDERKTAETKFKNASDALARIGNIMVDVDPQQKAAVTSGAMQRLTPAPEGMSPAQTRYATPGAPAPGASEPLFRMDNSEASFQKWKALPAGTAYLDPNGKPVRKGEEAMEGGGGR